MLRKRLYKNAYFIIAYYLFIFPITAYAVSYFVKTNGNNSNSGLSWQNAWKTIQKAADSMSTYDITYISNGIYFEQINITNKKYIQFIGFSTNVIITARGTNHYCFQITSSTNIKIANLKFCSNTYSMIYLTNSKYCTISNSVFHDNDAWYNDGNAIKLFKSYNCKIKNNLIYNIEGPAGWTYNCFGIALYYSDNNLIFSNEIKESGSGSYTGGSDIIFHGIYLVDSDNNTIKHNYIHNMDHFGIHIIVDGNGNANTDNKILDNIVHSMERAIVTENNPQWSKTDALTGQIIGRNIIFDTRIGIVWINTCSGADGTGGNMYKNSISANKNSDTAAYAVITTCWAKISAEYNTAYGYYDGLHFGNNGHIVYNNLTYSNYNKNVLNAGDNGGPWNQYVYYNCAESSTKIGPNIIYSTGSIYTNPLISGISNTKLKWNSPVIGKASSTGGISGCIGAHTSYLKPVDSTAGNTTAYTMVFVTSPYDGSIPADGKIQITFPDNFSFSSPAVTSFSFDGVLSISYSDSKITFTRSGGTDISPNTPIKIVFSGVNNITVASEYYFCIISIMSNNNKIIEKEESNYFRITPPANTTLKIEKKITNILLNNSPSYPIPGATIKYAVIYSNTGAANALNTIIYDKINLNVSFKTSYNGTATGWSIEYSTNTVPDQSFYSSDYSTSIPSSKNSIKWIRWKKSSVATTEDGLSLLYEVILK